MSLTDITEVQCETLLNYVAQKKGQGHRLVTITCRDTGDGHELLYHFDKDYHLSNLRLQLPKGATLPSITSLYFAAVIVENEMKDLFGLSIEGLALDYEGKLILAEGAPKAPLNKSSCVEASEQKPSEQSRG